MFFLRHTDVDTPEELATIINELKEENRLLKEEFITNQVTISSVISKDLHKLRQVICIAVIGVSGIFAYNSLSDDSKADLAEKYLNAAVGVLITVGGVSQLRGNAYNEDQQNSPRHTTVDSRRLNQGNYSRENHTGALPKTK